jgi:hypothetical protein
MAEVPVVLQVGQHAIDQQKQALAPDPGPKPSAPRLAAARGNNRALEKQLSDLQAELLDSGRARHLRPVESVKDGDTPAKG